MQEHDINKSKKIEMMPKISNHSSGNYQIPQAQVNPAYYTQDVIPEEGQYEDRDPEHEADFGKAYQKLV